LASRGYRRVESAEPDFRIAYHIIADEKVDIYSDQDYGYRYYYGYPGPYVESTTYAEPYLEGTLVLDIMDPESNTVMWRGWATTDLDDNPKPKQVQRYIQVAVKRILDRFPPEE
jgi:hypothetical protein